MSVEPLRATGACQPDTGIPVGVPFDLPVFVQGGCFCGEELGCVARISGERTLALDTTLCTPGATCDACFPSIGTSCAVPALDVGTWRVDINGAEAFEIDVRPSGEAPSPTCWTAAPVVEDSAFECSFPGSNVGSSMPHICHPERVFEGESATIRVVNPCASCFAQTGSCRATVEGELIFLEPFERSCTCDVCGDCPAICMENDVPCVTPPLDEGNYQVLVQGDVVSRLTVGAGGGGVEICSAGSAGGP